MCVAFSAAAGVWSETVGCLVLLGLWAWHTTTMAGVVVAGGATGGVAMGAVGLAMPLGWQDWVLGLSCGGGWV